jgi:co-chaperonin GroES (HSP10)
MTTEQLVRDAARPQQESINKSEIYPVEYKVLVKLDDIEEVSEGGIIVSVGEASEREQMSQVRGLLVAVGSNAFFDWKWKPEPGARVMIAKYAGLFCEGEDGEEYRLCNDKDIAAVLGVETKKGYRHDQRR